ncbi:MAG: DUF4339 domain-containing protein [Phycisphaera sp.]|nr:DUF4339 domain-containing protein [Phycisphaera sp.]
MDDGGAILVLGLIIRVICGAVAAAIASSKGRTPVGWFFAGFVFSIIGIIIIAVLSNVKDQRMKEDRQERENRRLREQLRQERMKSEAFRQHASARLDAHDNHAGIDTRQANMSLPGGGYGTQQPMLESHGSGNDALDAMVSATSDGDDNAYGLAPAAHQQAAQQQAAAAQQTRHAAGARHWHYERHGETRGPISEQQLISKLQAGEIAPATLLWTEELGDWKAAQDIRALQPFIRS